MDLHDLIPKDSEEELKCFICKNYLSYFPISLGSNSQSFCGRCTTSKKTSFSKNKAFEAVAHNLKFPCRYSSSGCFEKLTPNDIPQHEGNCPFENKLCPLAQSANCTWKGPLHEFMSHCYEGHDDKFLNNGEFEVNFLLSTENVNLLKFDRKLFIIEMKFDSGDKVLECAIYTHNVDIDPAKYPCHLSVQNGNNKVSTDFSLSASNEKKFSELCLQFNPRKRNVLRNVVLMGKITLGETNNQKVEDKLNLKILSLLQCTECSRMGPTVKEYYMLKCSSDSFTLCKKCVKAHCGKCSKCKGHSYPKSVEILNKIAGLLEFPCKFQEKGCDSVFEDYDSYKGHQYECPFEESDCIISRCDWSGCNKDVANHVLASHANLVFTNSTDFFNIRLRDSHSEYHFVDYRGKLFQINNYYLHHKYIWEIMCLDTSENYYNYELELRAKDGAKMVVSELIPIRSTACIIIYETQFDNFNLSRFKMRMFK